MLTKEEILQKPEVLKYLRRYGQEKKKEDLLLRFYNAVRKGKLTKEIVLGLKQKPKKERILKKYPYGDESN